MSIKKINVVIAGAKGYVGLDLTLLISKHPNIKISHLCAQKNTGKLIQYFDKRIRKKLPKVSQLKNINWNKVDLVFFSLPNGEAQKIIKKKFYKFKNIKFIDLSADFRITNKSIYKKNYKINHKAPKLINESLY